MGLYEGVVAFASFWTFLVILVGVVTFGWYCVWSLFLSRFRFVRELIGGMTDSPLANEVKSGRKKSKSSTTFRKD